jgi:hypothetical protein
MDTPANQVELSSDALACRESKGAKSTSAFANIYIRNWLPAALKVQGQILLKNRPIL